MDIQFAPDHLRISPSRKKERVSPAAEGVGDVGIRIQLQRSLHRLQIAPPCQGEDRLPPPPNERGTNGVVPPTRRVGGGRNVQCEGVRPLRAC